MSPSSDDLSHPRRNLAGPSDVDGFGMHGDPGLDDDVHLAAFRDELRTFADRPAPAMSQDLARFVAGLGGLTEHVPEASRRKRPVILQTLTAKLVAGGVAAFAMFSGLAVAGALPDGVQSAVSSAGDSVGVGFPHPGDHQAAAGEVQTETTDGTSSSTGSTTTSTEASSTTASTTAGDHTAITGSGAPTGDDTPGATDHPVCRAGLPAPTTTRVDAPPTTPTSAHAEQDPDACDDEGERGGNPDCGDDWTKATNPVASEHRSEEGAENIEHRDGACEDRSADSSGNEARPSAPVTGGEGTTAPARGDEGGEDRGDGSGRSATSEGHPDDGSGSSTTRGGSNSGRH
jgi:hypothetical protein